jgi:voltage-gated potassium channel
MVHYVSGAGGDPAALDRAAIGQSEIVVILAWNEHERRSDGKTFDIIHRVRAENPNAKIIAECVDDNNRDRLVGAGASVVVRPMRSYPEMIVGSLLNPGSSEILENLFTGEGEKIVCITDAQAETWEEVVMRYVGSSQGIPIAYREKSNGKIITVPDPKSLIDAAQVFVLTSDLPAGGEA